MFRPWNKLVCCGLQDTLPYTSPFQTDLEQWYALPNLTKQFFYYIWSFWAMPLILMFAKCNHQYERWGKIEFWKFFCTGHINVCLEQTSIWAVSGSHCSTAQPLILMVSIIYWYLNLKTNSIYYKGSISIWIWIVYSMNWRLAQSIYNAVCI